jgi:hypothetical protein
MVFHCAKCQSLDVKILDGLKKMTCIFLLKTGGLISLCGLLVPMSGLIAMLQVGQFKVSLLLSKE